MHNSQQNDRAENARPAKPSYRFSGILPPALNHLRDQPRWVAWDYRWKNGRWTKPPIDPKTGRLADVSDPKTWATFDVALAGMQKYKLAGVGLVLTGDDNLTGIDLDDCISDSDSLWDMAAEVIGYSETYAEISPSGDGIHLLALGKIGAAIKNDKAGVEVYGTGRYLTITGNQVEGTPSEIRAAPRTLEKLAVAAAKEKPGLKPNGHANGHMNGHARAAGDNFFANVNAIAMDRLDDWVTALHPTARKHATGAWRITSRELGRDLQEDLAYHPNGIKDHGEEHGLTPIDSVLRYGNVTDAIAAAMWLCQMLGIEPARLGWRGNGTAPRSPRAEVKDSHTPEEAEGGGTLIVPKWPVPEGPVFHGIVGEVARLATEKSEADPIAVAMTFLVMAGAYFGRTKYQPVGDADHHTRIYAALVGQSAYARKGTSLQGPKAFWRACEKTLREIDGERPFPLGHPLKHGNMLSSGEGLLYPIRDPEELDISEEAGLADKERRERNKLKDKRLFVVEEELANIFKVMHREGNTLSEVLRRLYDGGDISPMTKREPIIVTEPHVTLIGHITRDELVLVMKPTEILNGLVNRFLWMLVRRSKSIAHPIPMDGADVARIGKELAKLVIAAHTINNGDGRVDFDQAGYDLWTAVYPEFAVERRGILDNILSRGAVIVRRLAMTYAMLDGYDLIKPEHIEAALALWRYSVDSVTIIFGQREADPRAQKLIDFLPEDGSPVGREQIITECFGKNILKPDLDVVINALMQGNRIYSKSVPPKGGRGRPAQLYGRVC
jgi:hypothetical protein